MNNKTDVTHSLSSTNETIDDNKNICVACERYDNGEQKAENKAVMNETAETCNRDHGDPSVRK